MSSLLSSVSGLTDTYALAALALRDRGIVTVEAMYAALPGMHPRTVRRIHTAGSVLMCMSSTKELHTHVLPVPDSTDSTARNSAREGTPALPGGLDLETFQALMDAASAAGVDPKPALTAVTRFQNPAERVLKVLRDLKLAASAQAFRNVTGLFVRLMRSGQDVNLPMTVLAHQAAQQPQQAPAAPTPAPDTTPAAATPDTAPVTAPDATPDLPPVPVPAKTPAPDFMPDAGVAVRVMGDLGTAYRVVSHYLKNTVWMTCVEAVNDGFDTDVETSKLRPDGFRLKLTPA